MGAALLRPHTIVWGKQVAASQQAVSQARRVLLTMDRETGVISLAACLRVGIGSAACGVASVRRNVLINERGE